MGDRYRNICMTIHDQAWIPSLFEGCAYIIGQLEICPSSGKQHWQVYCQLNKQMRFASIQKALGANAHIENCRGSVQQNIAYCSKTESAVAGTQFQFGTLKAQGARSDLEAVATKISTAKNLLEVASEFPVQFIKYHNGITKLTALLHKPAQFRPKTCVFIHGLPGTGKTRWVYDSYGYENVYRPLLGSGSTIWFDGYQNEKVLLLDDFDQYRIDRTWLLQLLDGYPLQLPVKGGSCWNWYDTVVITHNQLWNMSPELKRRFSEIRDFDAPRNDGDTTCGGVPSLPYARSDSVSTPDSEVAGVILAPANSEIGEQ